MNNEWKCRNKLLHVKQEDGKNTAFQTILLHNLSLSLALSPPRRHDENKHGRSEHRELKYYSIYIMTFRLDGTEQNEKKAQDIKLQALFLKRFCISLFILEQKHLYISHPLSTCFLGAFSNYLCCGFSCYYVD